jgi:hypothetical protein
MQKDEEVGKVAQATPIVICTSSFPYGVLHTDSTWLVLSTAKALELFLSLIIEQANKVTSERGSKKVEAYHL